MDKSNILWAGLTNVGVVRQMNEDYFGQANTSNGMVFVVCDGMGGHEAGEVASEMAVTYILNCLKSNDFDNPVDALEFAVSEANIEILNTAAYDSNLRGMGTTVVMVLVVENQVFYAHAGDSRLYLLRNSSLRQLTEDHSHVQQLINSGRITPAQARVHPRRNMINNSLGYTYDFRLSVCETQVELLPDDIFLICTDGLNSMLTDDEIKKILQRKGTLQDKAQYLIDAANQAGGDDNTTVVLIGLK